MPKGFVKNASDEEAAKAWSQMGVVAPNMPTFNRFAVIAGARLSSLMLAMAMADRRQPGAQRRTSKPPALIRKTLEQS
jgi:hypothetical protein